MKSLLTIFIIMLMLSLANFIQNTLIVKHKSLSSTKQKGNQSQNSNQINVNNRKKINSPKNRAETTPSIWPNGIVYYKIDNSLSPYRKRILSAMQKIESKSCIRFKERTNQQDYVQFFIGDGCYSSRGRVGGRQYLSLGNGCHNDRNAVHEMLHALGFYHEQQRSDRDQYLIISWQNIEDGRKIWFTIVPESKAKLYTRFDFSSIMLYGPKAFSKNGKDTITPKVKGVQMGDPQLKKSPSPLDFQALNAMYSCN